MITSLQTVGSVQPRFGALRITPADLGQITKAHPKLGEQITHQLDMYTRNTRILDADIRILDKVGVDVQLEYYPSEMGKGFIKANLIQQSTDRVIPIPAKIDPAVRVMWPISTDLTFEDVGTNALRLAFETASANAREKANANND